MRSLKSASKGVMCNRVLLGSALLSPSSSVIAGCSQCPYGVAVSHCIVGESDFTCQDAHNFLVGPASKK